MPDIRQSIHLTFISISLTPIYHVYPCTTYTYISLYHLYLLYIYTINACIPSISLYYRYLCPPTAPVPLSSFITFTSVSPPPIIFPYVFMPIWLTFSIFSLSFAKKRFSTVNLSQIRNLILAQILLQGKSIYIFSSFFLIRDIFPISASVIRSFIDQVPLQLNSYPNLW